MRTVIYKAGHLDASLSRNARITQTLEDVGGAVLLGLLTTALGVAPLAFASSEVFRLFFTCFALIVSYAFLFGLVWTPVVLSLIGPTPFEHASDQTGAVEGKPTDDGSSSDEGADDSIETETNANQANDATVTVI